MFFSFVLCRLLLTMSNIKGADLRGSTHSSSGPEGELESLNG